MPLISIWSDVASATSTSPARTACTARLNAELALARIAGETAPLLFTALNNQYWNLDPLQPTASLTVQILNYAISPYDDWHQKAWTAALVLLLLVEWTLRRFWREAAA